MKNNYSKTTYLILVALFAAITAVCSWISIPLPFTPVPINLATLAVLLAGGLLGPKYGTLSMGVYVLLGVVGVPVFQGFTGGASAIVGPTGGYIIGYIACALVFGLLVNNIEKKGSIYIGFSAIIGTLVCYTLGTAWFIVSTNTSFITALTLCVFPFLIGDALKIILATVLIQRLKKTPVFNGVK